MNAIIDKAVGIQIKCIDINIEIYFPVFTVNTLEISGLFA